jgi:hypothetical protein
MMVTLLGSVWACYAVDPFFCQFRSLKEVDSLWKRSHWSVGGRMYDSNQVWVDTAQGVGVFKMNAVHGDLPVCSELESRRDDFLLGTYRTRLKTTPVAGAVEGFFIFRGYNGNVHNEVDIEILTQNIDTVWCTLHYDWKQSYYKLARLDFDPSADFHEYRFDIHTDRVDYYFDSKFVFTLDSTNVPDTASLLLINHWSNGNWGGPSPTVDTYMYVDYVFFSPDYDAVVPQQNGETAVNRPSRKAVNRDVAWRTDTWGQGPLSIYGLDGRLVGQMDQWDPLTQKVIRGLLGKGVYVIRDRMGHTRTITPATLLSPR